MFLKSLEIKGFKSFADKTELTFKNGITAIVGPNGSGKSNILDAVKWVLGEQSIKNLRGGKMQDVIFSGTEFRKPFSLAQVTLALDNSDFTLPIEYSDITITRRLFRSGESEYYINNSKCRLKDIQELFMDTGIGKEGYSIIGQGRIESLLSGKPEDRRELIEEAAGIVKYKTRKEEAEKRLINTEQNLQRINDIFSTYEERLKPLKEESEKAKKFLDISERLKSKEVTLILNNIKDIESRIKSCKNQLVVKDSKTKELLIESENYKKILQSLNEELERFELENSQKRENYYKNKSEIQKLSSEIDLLCEKIKNLNNIIDKSNKSLISLNEKRESIDKHSICQNNENEKLFKTQEDLKEKIAHYESIINNENNSILRSNELLEEKRTFQSKINNDLSKKENEISIIENDITGLENKIEEIKSSKEAYENSIKINEKTLDMLKEEMDKLDSKILEYKKKIRENKRFIDQDKSTLTHNENKLTKISTNYNKLEAKCNALINLDKQHEGYSKAVKNLMQHIDEGRIKGDLSNVCILGEVIKSNEKFELAIEIALGASISNIISEDEIIAKKLIDYLKKNNLGRATFLPLSIIKSKKINLSEEVKRLNGYIGLASELVEFDKRYANAIEYVLGRIIISEDMTSALNIAKKINYSYKIVTLEGEVVNPGGALTGGSLYNKGNNLIGRKREIEELKKEIAIYSNDINNLKETINNNKIRIRDLDELNLKLKDDIYNENIEKTKLEGKINSLNKDIEKLKRDLDISNRQMLILKESINNNFKNLDKMKEQLVGYKELADKNSIEIQNLESNIKSKREEAEKINNEITSLRIKKAQVDENILNRSKEIKRLEDDITELNSQIIALKKDIENSNNEIILLENAIDEKKNNVEELNLLVNEFENKFKEEEIERIKIKDNIKKTSEKLEEVRESYSNNEKMRNNLQVSLARHEAEKESIYAKLNEDMGITYAEAQEIEIKDANIEELKKDIMEYKSQISRLGVVNLAAIEEYEELYKKYTFMNSQKKDLIEAKEELLAVVEEMIYKMKTVFHNNFMKIRKNFDETFKELFKGGHADLILEGDDELEANIEISVQPPGKKLQNINLMSGGEKGLTAIALLFAILKMKPTPFCILDEIEAALDDYNVARFSEFLKKFSKNTQFIIITHRKGSMEASDILYGITMEEKGVSKIVSVDLNK